MAKPNLSQRQDWIWYSNTTNLSPTGSTGTTEFPQRLTHSYFVDLGDIEPQLQPTFDLQPPNLVEGLNALLALSLLGNLITIAYHAKKLMSMDLHDTKTIRCWIRISSTSGKLK